MKRTETISLDVDWLWRRAAPSLATRMAGLLGHLQQAGQWVGEVTRELFDYFTRRYLGQPHTADSAERGLFARSWPIGTTALWIAILLSGYVLLYYI
jgi:multicomponent Na+:H+ antiporter subunit D